MLEVNPFPAIRYNFERFNRDLSALLAPPYDVLDKEDKNALINKSEYNIVTVDLPHIPPKSAGPPDAYAFSAKLLQGWIEEGVMVRENEPALYVYHQEFEHGGQKHTRRMLIARVRLQPFSEGVILPHEQTFGGPKEDRLALTKATHCNVSPIFGLYADPEDKIGQAFAAASGEKPHATGTLDNVENRLWIVTDKGTIKAVSKFFADKRIYIADGHHRYGTALNFREWLTTEQRSLAKDHPANYVMFVLASMDDPGCLILPYNRVLGGVDLKSVSEAWKEGTEVADGGLSDLTLHEGATDQEIHLRFTARDKLRELEKDQVEAWYELDAAYLHRYLIDELLRAHLGEAAKVHYVKSAEDARKTAREENGVALLMNATPMAHLRAVSEQGGLMPQKSTYFYPKLATGLTINPLG
ncbi:MAG: DUF1015 domain-containing protein [Phycisphaerae bacterium]|nr:DUF1015 domain-containing protein [Phycisphaerae bacterium]